MQQSAGPYQGLTEDDDRTNRFLSPNGSDTLPGSRERAASQPPRTSDQSFLSVSPAQQQQIFPSSLAGGSSQWPSQRLLNPTRGGIPQPIPTRSSSFSTQSQSQFSVMREQTTIEDEELDQLSDAYDEQYMPPSLSPVIRGRSYNQELSRSRSQSLATSRPGPIGSPYLGTPTMASWNESLLSNPLNIPGARYGDIRPPGNSRYGSLGTLGRTSANIHSSSPSGGSIAVNGLSHRQPDISNISPFVRDVGQMVLGDGSALRDLWARDESGGGGSGTTSRRHSVSVVQPRRGTIVGFNAPGTEGVEESSRPTFSQLNYGRGGLMLSDEDLAGDLGLLNLRETPSSSQQPTSQPSSLPIYAPLSRSPATSDLYHQMNLSIPSGSYTSRQSLASPSDSGVSGGSPTRTSQFDQHLAEAQYRQKQQQPSQVGQSDLTARFIPGQGILPQIATTNLNNGNGEYSRNRVASYSGGIPSPLSPTSARSPQQQQLYQRRPSDTPHPLSELGKGVPLHSVPASWPLYIVEFKAGRTDLFYLTDLSLDVRVNDLVIVEADRGKDLGKVINDTITLAEVEAFQKQQMSKGSFGPPNSPGGTSSSGSGKKEINPKMIYGKASPQDMQGLAAKLQDEMKALQLCQTKVRAKKLPMEVVDAEYQWDRRKLTFYFVAEKRIDFRELVRELFRLYKTRIWMASLQGSGNYEQ